MSDSEAKISILMPAYNCERFVATAIDSILAQTYSNWELLVADDKSTDDTKKIIDSYSDPRIKCFHNTLNQGYLKTCNDLYNESTGEFITFQDADDYADQFRLEKLIFELINDRELMAVGSFVNRVDEEGRVFGKLQFAENSLVIRKALPEKFECVGSALMVRRSVTEELGLYHEFFNRLGSEDLYWFGVIASKYKAINIPEPLYYYRDNPNSVSQSTDRNVKKMMSKEFAIEGVKYYIKNRKIVFDNWYFTKSLDLYLIGKGKCWRKEYFSGIMYIASSMLFNPFYPPGRLSVLKLYVPKIIKK